MKKDGPVSFFVDLFYSICDHLVMANSGSYTITLSNNRSEKEAITYLLETQSGFILPDKAGRRQILEILSLDKTFSRAYDLILVKGIKNPTQDHLYIANPQDIVLVELKTTKKKLPDNPNGFFFGATENEFKLARKLGRQFKFCFVCLHAETKSHKLLTLVELEGLIKNKRTQYQINL